MEQTVQICNQKWYAIVGDNGFGYVSSEVDIIEGLRKLHHATIFELPSQDAARQYAYCAYSARWFMRNSWMGNGLELPVNLPGDYLYIDPQFEAREGGKQLPYFPALLY